MESIPKDSILEYNLDTIQFIRKQYDLDKPERLEEAINLLQEWLVKQDHLIKKEYSKSYLERTIIISKGSIEKAKMKLDRIATYRTLLPRFFKPITDIKTIRIYDNIFEAILPKLTSDHYRVFMLKDLNKKFDGGFFDFFRHVVMACEYVQAHDYCNGIVAVFDYSDANLFELIKEINVVETHQGLGIIMEGYGMRLKGLHFITASKAIDILITIVKQALSAKVAGRIHVHKKFDTLYNYIPKEILPNNYGGQQKSIFELSSDFNNALTSNNFLEYLKEMQTACTNENYRRDDKFNDQYIGMAGSFRKLTVD